MDLIKNNPGSGKMGLSITHGFMLNETEVDTLRWKKYHQISYAFSNCEAMSRLISKLALKWIRKKVHPV